MPSLTRTDHVLLKVKAVSLNPIDLLMLRGYGVSSFNFVRRFGSDLGIFGLSNSDNISEFGTHGLPMTPGRDFAGEVVDFGPSVAHNQINEKRFGIGSRVAGSTWPFLSSMGSGSLAQYILCPVRYLAPIPTNVDFTQATILGFAGLTAWSSLVSIGKLKPKSIDEIKIDLKCGPRILITGASGAVGMIAAQLCKLWGVYVDVTCPSDEQAISCLKNLNVDNIIPYPEKPPISVRYDLILDCVRPVDIGTNNDGTLFENLCNSSKPKSFHLLDLLNSSSNSRYIVLNPPLLSLTDQWGPILGSCLAINQFGTSCLSRAWTNRRFDMGKLRWAFFKPDGKVLSYLLSLTSQGLLNVPIHKIFTFDEVIEAFQCLDQEMVRGKIVIKV